MLGFDTNPAVHAANRDSASHLRCRAFIESLAARRDVAICELMLVELYLKLRNERIFAKPLTAAQAAAVCAAYRSNQAWQLIDCGPVMDELWEFAARSGFAFRRIVDTILAGDAVAAEDAARVHLDAVWQRLADTSDDGSLADDPLARACTYLDFHMQQPVQLAFIAEHVARTSTGHLGRLFRQRYGLSFTDYLREPRMHEAVGLLTTTSQPIGRIAKIVGYADASRFGVHFRRRYGLTPRAQRQRFGAGRRGEAEG